MDIGYAGALAGGLLSLLSPCSVMLLPAFFAYAFVSPAKLMARTGLFYLGLITTLVPLGIFSSTLGAVIFEHREVLVAVGASLLILVGIVQLLGINLPGLSRQQDAASAADRSSAVSVYFLGTVYAVAGICAGPILGSVLIVAALGGNPVYGGMMLALYALGMAIPLFVLAALWRKLGARGRTWLTPRTLTIRGWENSWIMVISGVLSIGIGVLLWVTSGTANLGGFFTVGTQYTAESWVSTMSTRISDVWLVVVAILVLGVVLGATRLRARVRRGSQPPSVIELR